MGNETKHLEQLQAALGRCQRCGPTKACKVSRSGEHIALTHGQLRGWALALAMGTHGVTLSTPPKSELFVEFQGPQAPIAAPAAPATPVPNPAHFMNPYFMTPPPWFMPPYTATPTAAPPQPQSAIPSSDPVDDGEANPYPEISTFILQLHERQPRRNLDIVADSFELHDFYHIDEITGFSVDELQQDYNLSKGNATFLLDAVEKEIKKVKRASGKKTKK
ncbi:hypothetical protein FPV67DRAFT_1663100 [Lyophyllum atratum]|nr:hypothetical protein FPV67DRAFT_1663100 [Lyophyllum atratum]